MKKIILQLTILLFATLIVGLVASFFGNTSGALVTSADVLAGKTGKTVSLAEAYALNQAGDAGFIDARPREFYNREHIRSAISVPYTISAGGDELASLDKQKIWVVYCKGPRCNQASILVQKLDRAGFPNIYLFPGGMEEWRLAQYPMEKSNP